MAKILYFSFTLSKNIGFPSPEVMIWVDKDDDGKGSPRESVLLVQDKLTWKGSKQVDVESTEGIWFLVAYRATIGARWDLKVTVGKEDGPVVCKDGQRVNESRHAFWGVCAAEKEEEE